MTNRYLRPKASVIFAALLLMTATAPATAGDASESGESESTDVPDQIWEEPSSEDATAAESSDSIADLVDRVGPAVANIIVAYRGTKSGDDDSPDAIPGPDGGFGQGSGFLIHPDGYLLTNYHVVEKARKITVRLRNGSEFDAAVVGADPKSDVALLKVEADRDFPALPLGDSSEVSPGERVLALGNPLGLENTVTSGIVSALDRHDVGVSGKQLYTDFIQVDVSINPGNSGGPLVDTSGRVVGINTAINRRGQGIGFALPINLVKNLLPQLKENGYVTRSYLGARVQPLTPMLAESFGMDHSRGALVTDVADDSPAAEAGLEGGDVILSFDGREVRTSKQLPWMVATAGPGSEVEIDYLREGDRNELKVELVAHPNHTVPDLPETTASDETSTTSLKVKVRNLTDSLARRLGAGAESGVVVTKVPEDSPAKGAGLRRRDVIAAVGETSVASKSDFEQALEQFDGGDVVRLKLIRPGQTVYIAFER